ncbi:glycosyltransferase family 2 protein [bacterium]|nr:MAG: glycosyltransferase family 2 protein [bacterium]
MSLFLPTFSAQPKLAISVIIPAYQEGRTIACSLAAVDSALAALRARYEVELVVVDDGSTDDTVAGAARFAEGRADVRVLRHPRNRGLGAALRTAFGQARGAYVVTLDADLSYGPEYVERLVTALEESGADMVLASAYMPGGRVVNVPWGRRVLSREANRFLSLATNARLHTLTCMVRAYRSELLAQLPAARDGMEINHELVFAALRAGANVVEIPARLAWSDERARAVRRPKLARAAAHIWHVLRSGIAHRPALLLALPGLLPGPLPVVAVLLYALHASARTIAVGVTITAIVQYASLAVFAGQAAAFFTKRAPAHRRHAVQTNR